MRVLNARQAAQCAALAQEAVLFKGLPKEEIAPLLQAEGIGCRRFRAGEIILAPGMDTAMLYILLRGQAAVRKRAGTGMFLVSTLSPCAMVGMAALFNGATGREYPTVVEAKGAVTALFISEAALLRLLHSDERIIDNYLRYLTERIHFLNMRIDGLIRPNAKERVYQYLLQNAVDGRLEEGLTTLAQALSISRATLYRALDALESEGAITRQGRRIMLSHPGVM